MVSACAWLCSCLALWNLTQCHEDMESGEIPECQTPLTTLLARGTAKHRLTPWQQADLETKQEEVAAQRNTAALEPHP